MEDKKKVETIDETILFKTPGYQEMKDNPDQVGKKLKWGSLVAPAYCYEDISRLFLWEKELSPCLFDSPNKGGKVESLRRH